MAKRIQQKGSRVLQGALVNSCLPFASISLKRRMETGIFDPGSRTSRGELLIGVKPEAPLMRYEKKVETRLDKRPVNAGTSELSDTLPLDAKVRPSPRES
jgi:hypothetical protein